MRNLEALHEAANPKSKPVPSAVQFARELRERMNPEGTWTLQLTYVQYSKWSLARDLEIQSTYCLESALKREGVEIYIGEERKKMIRKL